MQFHTVPLAALPLVRLSFSSYCDFHTYSDQQYGHCLLPLPTAIAYYYCLLPLPIVIAYYYCHCLLPIAYCHCYQFVVYLQHADFNDRLMNDLRTPNDDMTGESFFQSLRDAVNNKFYHIARHFAEIDYAKIGVVARDDFYDVIAKNCFRMTDTQFNNLWSSLKVNQFGEPLPLLPSHSPPPPHPPPPHSALLPSCLPLQSSFSIDPSITPSPTSIRFHFLPFVSQFSHYPSLLLPSIYDSLHSSIPS